MNDTKIKIIEKDIVERKGKKYTIFLKDDLLWMSSIDSKTSCELSLYEKEVKKIGDYKSNPEIFLLKSIK